MLSVCLLLVSLFVQAQPVLKNDGALPPPGNTYAIVIGISDYQYPDVPKLNFSNRDAVVFADFLMSASGGSVPQQNIRLLTDSMASTGEVDKALRWVLYTCQPNDRVYFYFSGHGEMENVTMNKNGYLICYNTPAVAITNMGLSIAYLNDVLNTLSVQTKAKVIAITDACHSGTMNGNKFRGNFFVGEQLMLKKENEIRMASSKPDQLSNENVDWGEGRGIFSYYLVNGLQGGLADANHDGTVSVSEIKTYLENKMANDPILKNEEHIQTPVIDYNSDLQLATVVEVEAKKIKAQVKNDSLSFEMLMSAMPSADEDDNAEPAAYFFNLLKKQNLESLTDSLKLNTLAPDEIAFAIIAKLKALQPDESKKAKLNELEAALKADEEQLNRFNLDLASSFLDIGQAVIANYIRGDEAELERRRYYNSNKKEYDVYTRIFAVALKLSQTNTYYSNKAAVFLHYFSGLALRLKIPLTENPGPLIEQALAEQKKALALEEHAAYIYNELGVLYEYKKMYGEAENYYTKATQLSPGWAIPQSNLSSLFIHKKNYSKALLYVNKADSLQKDLQSASINRGFIYEKQQNLLFAEEYYHNAIAINSRHFAPFERLGYVNMNTANYAMADSFFYEASLRKKGYHFEGSGTMDHLDREPNTPYTRFGCTFADSLKFKPGDMLAWFAWGVAEFFALNTTPVLNADGVAPHVEKNNPGAIKHFKKVISLDKNNPLVYHYLALVYYEQHQWEEAELMFRYAREHYMKPELFEQYLDSVKKSAVYPYDHDCYELMFRQYYYSQVEDLYFLASLYEKWGQPVEAEICYKKIIESTPRKLGVYLKLAQLLEKQGLYLQAENALKNCEKYYRDTVYRELNAFYRRTIAKEPDNAAWNYKLGLLLYDHAEKSSKWTIEDTILWFPKINREEFTTLSTSEDYSLDIGPGTSNQYVPEDISLGSPGAIIIPGTGEHVELAEEVLFPRYDGIMYLKKAAELISEKETLSSINYKIAEIYGWAGSKKLAYPYFEKSLALVPGNINARLKLVELYTALYKNSKAFEQLNYLYDSGRISFNNRLLFAKFNILAGNFDKATQLLNKADSIHPYFLPEIYNLYGLSNMLANKSKEAIAFYKSYIKADRIDSYYVGDSTSPDGFIIPLYARIEDKRSIAAYTLSRLYAETANKAAALQWLETAIGYGFNYSFVLQNDPLMDGLRKTAKWQTLVNGIDMKKYRSNKPAN